jgi:hypothetical protein
MKQRPTFARIGAIAHGLDRELTLREAGTTAPW